MITFSSQVLEEVRRTPQMHLDGRATCCPNGLGVHLRFLGGEFGHARHAPNCAGDEARCFDPVEKQVTHSKFPGAGSFCISPPVWDVGSSQD